MRILFLVQNFNGLSQRLYVELVERGHLVSVELYIHDDITREAVDLFHPDIIIAPFLKRAIPEDIYTRICCLIVHPGPPGDRGPSSLDWAILENVKEWGVTVLKAAAGYDAGDIWAFRTFPMRHGTKAGLYRNEVTQKAVEAVLEALEKKVGTPQTKASPRPVMRQTDRAIDWKQDTTEVILRKIRSGDGFPGVRDHLLGQEVSLFDAHPESQLSGEPGKVIAWYNSAVCRATINGAVWIGHLRDRSYKMPVKLPAVDVLADKLAGIPEVSGDFKEIWVEERDSIAYLYFPFYNGAMNTRQCRRLLNVFKEIDTKVIVLMGGPDFWSNGIHLGTIEVADSPADESWNNINAMNDLVETIIRSTKRYVISAMRGNAGAGGVFLALAADKVLARSGIVLNPHYKNMGNLYGSEFWTYLLPQRVGETKAHQITETRLPMGTDEALRLGLVDGCLNKNQSEFMSELHTIAKSLDIETLLQEKQARLVADEIKKPLIKYREEELEHVASNFYGFDPSYHIARYNFIHRIPKSFTPLNIALHRR